MSSNKTFYLRTVFPEIGQEITDISTQENTTAVILNNRAVVMTLTLQITGALTKLHLPGDTIIQLRAE